jgi:hypothetical protein
VGDRAMTLYRLNNPQMRVHSGKDDGNRENSQLQQQQQLLKVNKKQCSSSIHYSVRLKLLPMSFRFAFFENLVNKLISFSK